MTFLKGHHEVTDAPGCQVVTRPRTSAEPQPAGSLSAPITPAAAKALGMKPLTTAYDAAEQWMLDRLLADLKRNKIKFALVAVEAGVEVWREKR
jgi:hypothetical protein